MTTSSSAKYDAYISRCSRLSSAISTRPSRGVRAVRLLFDDPPDERLRRPLRMTPLSLHPTSSSRNRAAVLGKHFHVLFLGVRLLESVWKRPRGSPARCA